MKAKVKKKILHISKSFHPFSFGGIETLIYLIIQNMKKYYSFSVLSVNKYKDHQIYKNNFKHYSYKFLFSIFSTPISFRLLRFVKKNYKNFDIIHYHYPWPMMDIIDLFISKKKHKIVTYHSDAVSGSKFLDILYYPVAYFFLSKMDTIIVTSKNYFESSIILKHFKKKIKIIPIGINPKKTIKLENNFFEEDYILFLGSDRKYKGLDHIISASRYIKGKIILAGNINQKKISNKSNIKIVKNPSSIKKEQLLKNCSALILPSTTRAEAFGIVLLEAAKYKKPVITTELDSGNTYIVKHKHNGIVIPAKDTIKLANACNFLIKNKKQATVMGKNNFNRLVKFFTINKMIKKYYQTYS